MELEELPEVLGGRYRIVKQLAVGSMSGVYEVEHTTSGDRYALKLMFGENEDPTLVTRFRREGTVQSRLRASEHIVRVIEVDSEPELDDRLFIVMELLDGSDLGKLLEERGSLPPMEVLEYANQVGAALTVAHAAGIVHRDLKPQNLFLHKEPSGRRIIKLLDFGVARLLDPDTTTVTDNRSPIGTLRYIAPEQLGMSPNHRVGPTADVWAFGLIILELLVGQGYWKAKLMRDLVNEIARGPREPPSARWPALPPGFDAWFARACAIAPDDRFASVRDQVLALGPVLGAAGGPAGSR